MKKILFITYWYPNKNDKYKGIFIKNHADLLSKHHQLFVLYFNLYYSKKIYFKKITFQENYIEIEISSFLYKLFYFSIFLQYRVIKKIFKKKEIKELKFDVVVSNVIFPAGIIGYLISKKFKIPQIHIEHWSKFNHFFKKNPWFFLGKKTITNCKMIYPVSSFLKKEMLFLVPESKMTILQNKINNIFQYLGDKNHEKIVFTAIATWQEPKNPFLFLDAIKIIKTRVSDFNYEINIIGTGKQISEIKSKYDLKINFYNKMSPNEINLILNKTRFLLHGSDYETFSMVIAESLKTGTPVICSNVGIASEVINDSNGFICYSKDDWVKNILLGINKKYNYQKISENFNDIYSDQKILNTLNEYFSKL